MVTSRARMAALIVLAVLGYMTVAGPGAVVLELLAGFLVPVELVPMVAQLLGETLLLAVLCRIVAVRDWWPLTGLTTPILRLRRLAAQPSGLVLLLLLMLLILVLLDGLVVLVTRMAAGELSAVGRAAVAHSSTAIVVIVVVETMLLVGFNEELLFRGLALGMLLRDRGTTRGEVYRAVVTVSVLFGLAHLVHQAPLAARLALVASTAAWGVLLAGVRLASGSIWPGLLVHGLLDSGNKLSTLSYGDVLSPAAGSLTWSQAAAIAALLLVGVAFIESYLHGQGRRDHESQPAALST